MYILNFMRPSRLGAEVNFCWRTTNIGILWRLPSFSEAINSWKYQNLGIGQLSPVQPVSVFDIQMFLKGLTKVWRKTSPEKKYVSESWMNSIWDFLWLWSGWGWLLKRVVKPIGGDGASGLWLIVSIPFLPPSHFVSSRWLHKLKLLPHTAESNLLWNYYSQFYQTCWGGNISTKSLNWLWTTLIATKFKPSLIDCSRLWQFNIPVIDWATIDCKLPFI